MIDKLKPCPCGFSGELAGRELDNGFLSLRCPDCGCSVEAFTTDGLVRAWNKCADKRAAPEPATVAVDAGALGELREAMTKFRMLPESAVSRPAGSVARERDMEAVRHMLAGGGQ